MKRREYLTGLAGLGALSAATGQVGAETGTRRRLSSAVGDDTHHPGAPRFAPLGVTFYDRMFTDFSNDHADGKDRDNFSPRIVGDPQQDAENYSEDEFSWSLKSAPDGSSATIEYAPPDNDIEQWDNGVHHVAEFNPDVPGRYVLEVDAPDGTHEQVLHIFPEKSGTGGPPRLSIEGHYDSDNSEFVLNSNPKLAPNSPQSDADLIVEWLADGRDALDTEDITVGEGTDSWSAKIPKSALEGERCYVHAAPHDGMKPGVTDTVVLNPSEEGVEYPNRPPEWIKDGIMYEIFPRSFMGPPKEGEWPLYNSNAHFKAFETKLDYLEELNVDVIWFTPTVPSESGNWKPQNADKWDSSGGNRFKYVGGGPHGYDALSYFQKAEDLNSTTQYPDYVDEPWPWEEGYDPENNVREQARQESMAEFQDFLDAAHERDIKVCIDFVINHGGRHHPLFQDTIASHRDTRPEGWSYKGIAENNTSSKYFDWFVRQDQAIEGPNGDVVDPAPTATGFSGLRVMPQWNYGNVATREHILAAAKHWAEMGVDAFRCDIAYGVPHSFWKEVRDVVLAENSDFMMLDETIPNDPTFAEDEFDIHFDTADFMAGASHGVINGGDPMQLYDAVAKRENEGWPDHALILNATENHDEQRLYKLARDGSREDPAKAQRAVWASGVLLEGVPFIYYGQERLITEYGHNRYNYDGTGEDYRSGDVGPGGFQRAFMNWEENGDTVPQDHLQFYKDVTTFYKNNDIFKPDADMEQTWFQSDDSVLVFGRSMETEDGTQNVVVMLHFDPGTATVDLLPGTSTTNMFSGNDIGVDSEGEAVSVEFDTLAVVETDSLFSVGEQIAQLTEETGDDNGPGSYTYPTGDAYGDGAFDMSGFTIHTTADALQFRAPIAGDLTNPADYAAGLTAQHLQIYIQNPEAENGATAGRTGTNVTFEDPYQYRVVANGQDGVLVEDHEGNQVAEGSLKTNPVADEIVVEIPKDTLDAGIRSHYLAPLMFGYHPDGDGGVMPVQSEAGEMAFGGAETPEMAPRVIDMAVPETSSQSEALSYSSDSMATLPYTSLASEYEQIGQATDPTGDDNGPGNFQYPSGPSGEHYEGMWDISSIQVYESRSRTRFEYTMATEMQNVWGLNGISQQFPQVYIHDPNADDDVPTSTAGREGLNVGFAEPYHYRVVVHGEGTTQVENANGEVVSSDVNLSVDGSNIIFDLPTSAVGGSVEGAKIAALVAPYDGFGTGGVRQSFAAEPGEYTIGTNGEPTQTAPHVMDMVPPDGTSQAQALAYTESATAEIPLAGWESTYVQTEGLPSITDPEGDDTGPGTYTYPTADAISEGCYDVSEVEIESTTQYWNFTVHIDGPLENPWGGDSGFSVQAIHAYIQDPNAGDDAATSAAMRTGLVSSFQEGYHYRVAIHGESGPKVVETATGETLAEGIPAEADQENSTISFSVPKTHFQTENLREMKMTMMMLPTDGFGTGGIRQSFGGEAAQWAFGGAKSGTSETAPRIIDLIGPENVVKQEEALSYSADSAPTVPLYTVESLVSGEVESSLQALAPPVGDVWAGQQAQLDASSSSDPDGQTLTFQWTQTAGPSVELSGADTAQPTFTAPEDVEEETTLEFEVTVTDPDDNSASATTSATVVPQSANDAPVAEVANGDRTVDPGEIVLLDGAPSEDPNGGELSFQWTQSGGEPSVELSNAETSGAAFTAPEVDSETTLTFTLTVDDGQGKTASTDINITVRGTGGGTTTEDDDGGDTGSGFGPGFGVVSGALGTAGGAAYAAKRLLGEDEPAQPDDVDVDDVEEPADD